MSRTNYSAVAFKGMERLNSTVNADSGACEEIINLRPRGNTWRNVAEKQERSFLRLNGGAIDYSVIPHPASQEHYTVLWDKTNNRVRLYALNGIEQQAWGYPDKIVSVSSLENVLTVCTQTDKIFYLWRPQQSRYIRLSFESSQAYIRANGFTTGANNELGYNGYVTKWEYTESVDEISHYRGTPLRCYDLHLDRLTDTIKASFEKDHERKEPQNKDRFRGLSLYRVALELYDNTFVNYSNVDYADTVNQYGDCVRLILKERTDQDNSRHYVVNKVVTPHVYGQHEVTINFDNLNEIAGLMEAGVVKNISLFMTIPKFCYDVDDWKNYKTDLQLRESHDPYKASHKYVQLPIDKTIYNDFESGVFFRVKTYDKEDLDKLTPAQLNVGRLVYRVKDEDVKNLSANKTLPTPNVSEYHTTTFANAYTYNGRQHLYGLRHKMFGGYKAETTDNRYYNEELLQTLRTLNPDLSELRLFCTLSGEYNLQPFSITRPFGADKIQGNTLTLSSHHLGPDLQYPITGKIKACVFVKVDDNRQAVLCERYFEKIQHTTQALLMPATMHEKENRYFAVADNFETISTTNTSTGTPSDGVIVATTINISSALQSPQIRALTSDKRFVDNPNTVQLTELANPLKLPSDNAYTFGEHFNRVLAVSSSHYAQSTTERNFGMFPLYVFCEDGIYAMQVGNGDVCYSLLNKLNGDRITNPHVVQCPQGVAYMTATGLFLLSGKGLKQISEPMRGTPTITAQDNLDKIANRIAGSMLPTTRAISKALDVTTLSPFVEFYDEVAKALPYYCPEYNELCLTIPDRYTYVYNLDFSCWYKRSDKYRPESHDVLSNQTTYTDNIRGTKTTIKLYNTEEDKSKEYTHVAIITKAVMLTTPVGWGRQSPTRQYKHLERVIFNLQYTTSDDFYLVLMGSNDGTTYNVLKYYHHPKAGECVPKQDVYLSRTLRSCKYLTLWVLSRDMSSTRIGAVSFEHATTREADGME